MKRGIKTFLSAMIVVTILVTSVCGVFADNGRAKGNPHLRFSDVGEDFWGYQAILKLTDMGVLTGYNDKTFKPNTTVTRSQFATMLVKALDLTAANNTQTFTDVPPTSWDYKYVEAAANYLTAWRTSTGLYFYGGRNSVREDMAVALVKALKLTLVSDNNQLQQIFSDYDQISASMRDYVYTAYKEGIMVGSNGKFKPQGNLTRAEAAALLLNALIKSEKVPVDDGQKVPTDNTSPSDASLNSLKYNGAAVTGFSQNTLVYNIVLPAGTTTIPVVTATVNAAGLATATVTQAVSLPGTAVVGVTAQDGTTHKTYIINFTVAAAAIHTDATLSNLSSNGVTLTGFVPGTLVYNVVLPAGTTAIPVVTAAVNDTGKATAAITQAVSLPGTAVVGVTAQDGVTHKTYIINFTVAAAAIHTDATLSNLSSNGVTLTGFVPGTLVYNVVLPAGTTAIPVVTATVSDTGKATAAITQAVSLPGTAVVGVTAQDGVTHKTYIINFTVAAAPKHTDATLSSMAINGVALTGFTSGTLTYDLVLPAGTTAIPAVTAVVNDTGKATANITQATVLPGHASVVVTAEDGTTQKTYTINFIVSAS